MNDIQFGALIVTGNIFITSGGAVTMGCTGAQTIVLACGTFPVEQ